MKRALIVMGLLLASMAHGGALEPAGWYGDAWRYRVMVTIDSTKVTATLTNFPVYIDLDDLPDAFFTRVQSAGGDIRVTESDGTTEMACEVVDIDTSGKTGELWFKADSLPSTVDSVWYIYYGNVLASEPGAGTTYGSEAVWNANYEMVLHLGEGDSTAADYYKDSTSNDNHATLTDADADTVALAGQIGGSVDLAGDADYLQITDSVELDGFTTMTVSMWLSLDTYTGLRGFINKRLNYNSEHSYSIGLGYSGSPCTDEIEFEFGTTGSNYFINCADADAYTWTSWNLLTATYDSGAAQNVVMYMNGAVNALLAQDDGDAALHDGTADLYLGIVNSVSPTGFVDGAFDEVRVMSAVMTPTWVETEYNMQSGTFYSAAVTEPTDYHAPIEPGEGADPWSGDDKSEASSLVWFHETSQWGLTNQNNTVYLYEADGSASTPSSTNSNACLASGQIEGSTLVGAPGTDEEDIYCVMNENNPGICCTADGGADAIVGGTLTWDFEIYAGTCSDDPNVQCWDNTPCTGTCINKPATGNAEGITFVPHASSTGRWDGYFYVATQGGADVYRYELEVGSDFLTYVDVTTSMPSGCGIGEIASMKWDHENDRLYIWSDGNNAYCVMNADMTTNYEYFDIDLELELRCDAVTDELCSGGCSTGSCRGSGTTTNTKWGIEGFAFGGGYVGLCDDQTGACSGCASNGLWVYEDAYCGDDNASSVELCDGTDKDFDCSDCPFSDAVIGDCEGDEDPYGCCTGAGAWDCVDGDTCANLIFDGGTLDCEPTCDGYSVASCTFGAAAPARRVILVGMAP